MGNCRAERLRGECRGGGVWHEPLARTHGDARIHLIKYRIRSIMKVIIKKVQSNPT